MSRADLPGAVRIDTVVDRHLDRDRRRQLLNDPACWTAGAVAAGWLACYAGLIWWGSGDPDRARLVGDGVYLLPIVVAALVSIVAARRAEGRTRRMWRVLAASNVAWLAGELIWSGASFLATGTEPAPPAADVLYLLSYALAIPGVLLGFRPTGQLRQLRGLLDAGLVVVGFGALGSHFLIEPQLTGGVTPAMLTTAAYPLLDLALLACLVSIGMAGHRRVPYPVLLVGAAFACAALSDVAMNFLVVNDAYLAGGWLNLGWQAQAVLLSLAALVSIWHPEPEADAVQIDRDLTLVPVLVAAVATFTLVLVDQDGSGQVRRHTLVVAGLMLAGLVVRQFLFTRDRSRLTRQLQAALHEQERAAVTDGLTGLYNRRFLMEMLKLEADRYGRARRPLSLVVIDLDHFKRVNDTHGHPVGDLVLVQAANRIRQVSRASDIVARYGGEEFVVLLPDTSERMAAELAERCRDALRRTPVRAPGGHDLTVTGSVGVATAVLDPSTGALNTGRLVADADRALYRAKAEGRDRTVVAGQWTADPVAVPAALPYPLLWIADRIDGALGSHEHSTAVERWSRQLGQRLGLDTETVLRLAAAARLHDVGKAAVDERLLSKSEPLAAHEWDELRRHSEEGGRLLRDIGRGELASLVEAHHERFDGTGYPRGLAGPAIPLEARIIAVCDSWAAMRVDRAYARSKSVAQARREILAGRGGQFDPEVADAFLALVDAGLIDEPRVLGDPPAIPGRPAVGGPAGHDPIPHHPIPHHPIPHHPVSPDPVGANPIGATPIPPDAIGAAAAEAGGRDLLRTL